MAPTQTITLPTADDTGDGIQVTVRELTVGEVRAWINESAASAWRDPVHALAFDDIGLDELVRMCDRPSQLLEAFSPSELQPLVDAAKALNPFFFRRLRPWMMAASQRAQDAPPTA